MVIAELNKRRVSYVLPPPNQSPPLLDLPPFGTVAEDTRYYPLLTPTAHANGASNGAPKPLGSRNPFAPSPSRTPVSADSDTRHPRHRLGISSLALDTSTVLAGHSAPGGILYTGGRDGLVASWELHVPHSKRRGRRYRCVPGRGTGSRVRWEKAGDGGVDWEDDGDEGDEAGDSSSEEDDFDAAGANGGRKVPYEDRWEVNREEIGRLPPPTTTFRESVQTHTDWVNAMVLCNMNQTVITASSDRTIRAWSPHADGDLAVPALIGHHTDYVRSLAFAKYPKALFSGALDRDITVWDIQSPRPNEPVLKVRLSEMDDQDCVGLEGEWGSIYALAVDPAGQTLAAGTPERVVRLWDPRAGSRSTTKLVGHTECVRSIVISDDGRYMLTGSSDTTVKLWSIGEHRCLHTFNHHTSSVWALHSTHPNLERFYTGSRDGHLCVVDVEQCGDMSEGECVVLAREGNPSNPSDYESKTGDDAIRSISAMDDEYVWTATSSSDVHRWRDVGRRVGRLDMSFDGAAYKSLDEGDGTPYDPRESSFEPTSIIDSSAFRNKSLAMDNESDPLLRVDSRSVAFAPEPRLDESLLPGGASSPPASANVPGVPSSLRERLSVSGMWKSSVPGSSGPNSFVEAPEELKNGIPFESLVCLGLPDSPYSFGFSSGAAYSSASLASARKAAEEAEAAADRPVPPRVAAKRAFEDRDVASEAKPLRSTPDAVIAGSPGLIRSLILNDRLHVVTLDTHGEVAVWHLLRGQCLGRFSQKDIAEALELERGVEDAKAEIKMHPQEVLELVQHRIEGKNHVLPWCQVDTKVGLVTVHLEGDRVFAAETLAEELGFEDIAMQGDRVNIGKVALANLFRGLIHAEEAEVTSGVGTSPTSATSSLPSVSRSPNAPTHIAITPVMSPRHRTRALSNASIGSIGITPSINITGLATRAQVPALRPEGAPPTPGGMQLGQSAPASSSGWLSSPPGEMNSRSGGNSGAALGMSLGAPSPMSIGGSTPGDMGMSMRDYFGAHKLETSPTRTEDKAASATPEKAPVTPTASAPSGGGLLGKKFKGFGKKKSTEPATPMATVTESKREAPVPAGPEMSERDKQQLLFLDALRARPFKPPTTLDAAPVDVPPSTAVTISEQAHADGAYIVTYRSQVSSTERDIEPLEMNSPFWLLNFLFTSATPEERKPPKITLVLVPMGESVNSPRAIKVQASRTALVRGVMQHLQETLSQDPQYSSLMGGPNVGSAQGRDRATSDASAMSGVPPPAPMPAAEDVLELLCNQHIADPSVKVATLKAYYWRGGVDMILHWRVKGQA